MSEHRAHGAVVAAREVIVHASTFDNEKDTLPKPYQGPVITLIGRHRSRGRKGGTPAYSMATYAEGATRGNAGVEEVTALVFDFDHLSSGVAEQVNRHLEGWAHIAYSSYSHFASGDDDCCFRAVLFCTRPIQPDEYAAVWSTMNELLGGWADRQATDLARIWYLPACPSSRMRFAWLHLADGALVDVDGLLDSAGASSVSSRASISGSDQAEGTASKAGKAARGGGEGRGVESEGDPFPEGERNARLTSLAGTMRSRGMEEEAILAALRVVSERRCRPPLGEPELAAIAASVAKYDPEPALVRFNFTDLGNAERLVEHASAELRYVHKMGAWIYWDGRRWARDDSAETIRRAKRMVRELARCAPQVRDEKRRDRLLRHAMCSESSGKLKAMLELGQALLPLPHAALDRQDMLFNCGNGTLDLVGGDLLSHRREDYLTRISGVVYDPEATCPRWEAFLLRVMGDDPELVAFLQRAVGYTLTGSTREQVLFLLYGVGANGKSTFIEILRLLTGEYAAQAEFSTFLKQDGASVRNDIARLVGARFVAAVEAEGGRPLAEAMVKQMTGGDVVTARFLFREFFEFQPAFKVWLAANHKPVIRGTDHGIWRRIRLIPFLVTIPEAERDPDLVKKLQAELPGVLAWAMRGCLDWQEHGLGLPSSVRAATESYRDEMDVLGGFLDDRCALEPHAQALTKELYDSYKTWADESGERAITKKAMGMRLAERGFISAKGSRGARCWQGLRLLPEPPQGRSREA